MGLDFAEPFAIRDLRSPTAAAELTPAQQRMKACNTQAKAQQLEGARRNRFMTACLNGDGHARTPTPRQRRHEECNQRARGLPAPSAAAS